MIGSSQKVDSHASRAFSFPLPFPRVYRAHVQPADYRGTERTAFVEAAGHRDAIRKIANAVAAREGCSPESVIANRIYNTYSARELIEDGVSEDVTRRLFETGWSQGEAISFCTEPLFLVPAPAALIRVWAKVAEVDHV